MEEVFLKLVKSINRKVGNECFEELHNDEKEYLVSLKLPKDIEYFYRNYNPKDYIEINGIRLLPLSVIKEENTDYTQGISFQKWDFL